MDYDKKLVKWRARRDQIMAMIANGKKPPQIAKILRISPQRVRQVVKAERE